MMAGTGPTVDWAAIQKRLEQQYPHARPERIMTLLAEKAKDLAEQFGLEPDYPVTDDLKPGRRHPDEAYALRKGHRPPSGEELRESELEGGLEHVRGQAQWSSEGVEADETDLLDVDKMVRQAAAAVQMGLGNVGLMAEVIHRRLTTPFEQRSRTEVMMTLWVAIHTATVQGSLKLSELEEEALNWYVWTRTGGTKGYLRRAASFVGRDRGREPTAAAVTQARSRAARKLLAALGIADTPARGSGLRCVPGFASRAAHNKLGRVPELERLWRWLCWAVHSPRAGEAPPQVERIAERLVMERARRARPVFPRGKSRGAGGQSA